jgi:hypothetical protein
MFEKKMFFKIFLVLNFVFLGKSFSAEITEMFEFSVHEGYRLVL